MHTIKGSHRHQCELTWKGPFSDRNPSSELQPGPPFSHRTTGSFRGSFWDVTNLGKTSVGSRSGVSACYYSMYHNWNKWFHTLNATNWLIFTRSSVEIRTAWCIELNTLYLDVMKGVCVLSQPAHRRNEDRLFAYDWLTNNILIQTVMEIMIEFTINDAPLSDLHDKQHKTRKQEVSEVTSCNIVTDYCVQVTQKKQFLVWSPVKNHRFTIHLPIMQKLPWAGFEITRPLLVVWFERHSW